MLKGLGMRMYKYGLRVSGLLVLATLCLLCAVQVSMSGWGLVFDARPCESQSLPSLETHYLPFLPFDDSALHPAPYTDDETHIDRLLTLCHTGDSVMITAEFEASGDAARSVYDSTCFPLEIATAQGARSMGHCSDFVQYIYFAGARLSDDYGAEATLQHARQCPNSSFLHGEYPFPDLFKQPGVRNYWMPNIEQVKKEQEELIPLTYRFLGKTHKAVEVIRHYLKKHSLPDTTQFISHTSPDPLTPRARQTERNFDSFYHGYGHSGRKATPELLQCWASNPSFPNLTVLGRNSYPEYQNISNINLVEGVVDVDRLRRLQRSAGVHMCPSSMEGYGHYISEARGMGALVVTTDFGPMNEFVMPQYSGVLIRPGDEAHEGYMALEHVAVHPVSENICESVREVLKMPLHQRRLYGDRGRRLYEVFREEMKHNLRELKREIVEHFSSREDNTMSQLDVDSVILECNRKLHEAKAK